LCGARVLRLHVSPATPDGAVWLYLHPNETLRLRLAWERGPEAAPARQTVRPAIDFARSGAHFSGDRLGSLEFALEELPGDSPNGDAVTVYLRPLFDGLEALPLPPGGVPGQLHLATAAGSEIRPALLLPPPPEVALTCADPSIARRDGAWQLYQRGRGVRVPLRLTTAVPVWAGGLRVADDSDPDIVVEGFADFVRLDPDQPHAFALRIDSTHWDPETPHHFKCFVDLAALGPLTLGGAVVLQEGGRLLIGGPNPRLLEVPLGRTLTASFPLTAEADDVTVVDYVVRQDEAGPDWLRVTAPPRAALPLTVRADAAAQLVVEVDASRLDRRRYAGTVLHGGVELLDTRGRRWTCEVHATVTRPPALGGFVALDWGAHHTCAACRAGPGEPPRLLALDEEQQRAPEAFPSDVYFYDLSDPQNPVIVLGHEAVRRAREHPECRLRGLQRKFAVLEEVFVQDEQGRGHTYPMTQLAELVLERLVLLAEAGQGQEIHQLALTFPARWPARVLRKLEGVTRALAVRLQRDRQPFPVRVLPPQIDAATAAALQFVTAPHGRALPDTFHLIVCDCGGGATETAVLEVQLPADPAGLRTRFLGVGGRGDFGGDDVTRAVLLLLHDRLSAALERRTVVLDDRTQKSARVQELPLTADGTPLRGDGPGAAHRHQLGRRNWEVLWEVAELIKIDLCEAEPDPAPAPPPPPRQPTAARVTGLADDFTLTVEDPSFESAIASAFEQEQHGAGDVAPTVAARLRPRLAELHCRVLIQPGPVEGGAPVEVVWGLDAVLDPLEPHERDALLGELPFSLEHACEYPLEDPHGTGQRYNVRQRVEDVVRELQWLCGQHQVQPHVAVLAGGGCRLPLVARLLRQYFPSPPDLLSYQKEFGKRRAAHGLASYSALREVLNLDRQLGRAVDVLHRPLGFQTVQRTAGALRLTFEPVAPAGARVNDPAVWHPFTVTAAQLRDADGNPRLTLFVQDWRGGPRAFGVCDLTRPAPPPCAAAETYQGGLRLCGPRRVEVRLALGGATYGPYPVTTAGPDPEALLQI
jgi:hypothetical protein